MKLFQVLIAVGLAGLLPLVGLTGCKTAKPTSGKKVGHIVKIADEGYIFKTHEAQLIRGGMSSGTGAVGMAPFDFTIQDNALLAIAEEAMVKNLEVEISYEMPFIAWSASREDHSGGVVTAIVILNPTAAVVPESPAHSQEFRPEAGPQIPAATEAFAPPVVPGSECVTSRNNDGSVNIICRPVK